jgi:hypothetical protein
MSAPPPPETYHSPGKAPVESCLAHRIDPSRWSNCAAPTTLDPDPRTCTSRRISVVRHVCDDGEGRAGSGGGAQIGEEEGGRSRGAGADAYSFGKGHF